MSVPPHISGLVVVLVALVAAGCAVTADPASDAAPSDSVATGDATVAPATATATAIGPVRLDYGDHPSQHVTVLLPAGEPRATVVLVHGGFWMQGFGADLMEPLARSLVDVGHAVVNLEYRRVGGGGGWPETFLDVATGLDLVAGLTDRLAGRLPDGVTPPRLDVSRTVVVGHSAGGHLALWSAARGRLPVDAPGGGPVVVPCAVVSQAGVNDLAAAHADGVGSGAVEALLGGTPQERPQPWAFADPARLAPTGIPTLLVHGTNDHTVPLRQSEAYLAVAGSEAELVAPVETHFDVIDPTSGSWRTTLDWIAETCAPA